MVLVPLDTHLARTDGTLNSGRYICIMLNLVVLPIIQAMGNAMFVLDNALSHVAGFLWNFLDVENVRLLSWNVYSSDLSPTENARSMFAK